MGCCYSGRRGEVLASRTFQEGAVTDGTGGGSQSVTAGKRSESPSAAAITASMCVSGNRRNDQSSMEEIRRSYLQGRLNVDDGCPLTDRQLYGLIKSWKAINRNMSVTAINMFVRYVINLHLSSPWSSLLSSPFNYSVLKCLLLSSKIYLKNKVGHTGLSGNKTTSFQFLV